MSRIPPPLKLVRGKYGFPFKPKLTRVHSIFNKIGNEFYKIKWMMYVLTWKIFCLIISLYNVKETKKNMKWNLKGYRICLISNYSTREFSAIKIYLLFGKLWMYLGFWCNRFKNILWKSFCFNIFFKNKLKYQII